jgi:hypothetical protein
MKRRNFIASAILGSSAILLQTGCGTDKPDVLADPPVKKLVDNKEFEAIGREFMDREQLTVAAIRKELDGIRNQADITSRITEDFREGRIIVANGWVLSRTEALQCALLISSTQQHAH